MSTTYNYNKVWKCFIIVFLLMQHYLFAAPHVGEIFKLKQPDGSHVKVRVWGDEYYQRVESIDGYTLIRNTENWICYAKLSEDGSDFIATDIVYKGTPIKTVTSSSTIPKSIRINPQARRAKADAALHRLEIDEHGANRIRCGAPRTRDIIGDIKGLTLLVDFSDKPATIHHLEVNDYINTPGYTGFDNNGSVNDFFKDVSAGKLNYTNYVAEYYRAINPKTYYDHPDASGTAKELVLEALNYLEDQGFDFSTLTTDNGNVVATNLYYSGFALAGWGNGLWPHAGSITFNADGVSIRRYQMTPMQSKLSLGTFCHENGHMVCGLPDLYDPQQDSKGVGNYCIMGYSWGINPVPFNPYFRELCGWETITDISTAGPGSVFKHVANSITSFIYKNPSNPDEFFYIDSRVKKGRNGHIPDAGLMIWHVDENGSSSYQDMTPSRHYMVSVEQADSLFHLENNANFGLDNDLFHKGYNDRFNDNTMPDAKWWDESNSGLDIVVITDVCDTMIFALGDYSMTLISPAAGDTLYADDSVTILWHTLATDIPNVKLQLSTDSGQAYIPIVASAANTDSYPWKVPVVASNKCIIALSDVDDNPIVYSGLFSIMLGTLIATDPDSFSVKVDKDSVNIKDDTLRLTNDGKGTLEFSITTIDTFCNQRAHWLRVSPIEGTVDSASSFDVKVKFVSTNLAEGNYLDTLHISHNAINMESPVRVICKLEVIVGSSILFDINIATKSILINSDGLLVISNVEKEPVSIAVYDIRGRRLIYDQLKMSKGIIKYGKIKSLANGTYIYMIGIGSKIIKRRFIISK